MFTKHLQKAQSLTWRYFSQSDKAAKYAISEHREPGLITRRRLENIERTRRYDHHINSPNYHPLAKKKRYAAYSKQHPKDIDGKDAYIISYKRPVKPLTPRYNIPVEAVNNIPIPFTSPTGSKFAETVLVGPPNAGKSTIINSILEANVTAVSDKT